MQPIILALALALWHLIAIAVSVIIAGHIEKKQGSALWQWVLNLIPVNLVRLLMLWT